MSLLIIYTRTSKTSTLFGKYKKAADATDTAHDRRKAAASATTNNISQEEGDVNKNSNSFIEPKNTLCR